jgi:phosphoribosyl 1,2-cyclic phosphodiesterase
MKLKVLGSNSAGNCYILENDKEALIVEAGIDFRNVKKALGFNLSKVSGAIITHQHGDHSKYVASLVNNGIATLALEDVFSSHDVSDSHFAKSATLNKCYKIGDFFVTPFPVSHDVPCVGYLIRHSDFGKLLFVTDTMMLNYTFAGLTQIMIETNYADDILDRRLADDDITLLQRNRVIESHMSLETAKDILKNNDLSSVDNIILIHLSNGSSDEARFIREVTELTGKRVFAADKGLEVELSTMPY